MTEIETLISETVPRVPVFELLANIGGQLGLWLGASLVTLLQLLFYCAASLCDVCCEKFRRTAKTIAHENDLPRKWSLNEF